MKNIKFIIIVCFYTFSTICFSQITLLENLEAELFLPSQFSWNNVKTKTGVRNFITPPRMQPSQGPCLSYASIAAAESVYKIEYNDTNSFIELSDTYFDYDITHTFTPELVNRRFQIPFKRTTVTYKINEFLRGFTDETSIEFINYRKEARKCIKKKKDFLAGILVDKYEFIGCGDLVSLNDFITIGKVNIFSSENFSIKKLKEYIISNGPVVVKVKNRLVNGIRTIERFKDYQISNIEQSQYHAYAIIGWENDGNNTKWILKDSWPYAQGIIKTNISLLPDNKFIELTDNIIENTIIHEPQLTFFGFEKISKNNSLPLLTDKFFVNRKLQEPIPIPLIISNIISELHSSYIGDYLYSKFIIASNVDVTDWQWRSSPNCYTRSLIKNVRSSSILISPVENGLIKVEVRAKKDGFWTNWKSISLQLGNGSTGGQH
ncbi:MAG: C1 family peptidase [Polaribacter sp.]